MARILTVTRGLPSAVYPVLELARRLTVAGHQVTFASSPEARGLADRHGLAFLPLEASRYGPFIEADGRYGALARLVHLRSRVERAREAMAVGGFVQDVRRVRPDLILINGEMHEHIIAGSEAGVPMAALNAFVSIWKRPGLPPPHHLVRPGVGWKGTRAGIFLLWRLLRLRKSSRALAQRIQRVGCDRLSVLRALARDARFDFRRETDAGQWLIPFTYRRLPALSLHALEFEFPHTPPPHVHYVGPMLLESRDDRPMPSGARSGLEALFERRRLGGERRLIYAAFGSAFSTDISFLRRLIGIVAARPHWDLAISLSEGAASSDLGPLPARVHAFSWAPQLDILRHCDAMVTHGGINTIDECVLSGVPMLVYCGFETDMGGNTARVVHHGIGIAGDRRLDGTDAIRGHIDRLLNEPDFRRNVERLRRSYAAYAADRVAERTVERLLDASSPDQPAGRIAGTDAGGGG